MADGVGAGNHHLAMNIVEPNRKEEAGTTPKTTRTNLTNFILTKKAIHKGVPTVYNSICAKYKKQVKVIKDVTSQVTIELVDPKAAQGGFPDTVLICF